MDLDWGAPRRLVVDGVGLHAEIAGPDDAPSVVCLHGFGSGTFTWAGVAPALAARARVIAWDRPPFGRSDRPRPRTGDADPYAPAAQRRQLAAVVEQLAAPGRPLVLVGHSAGGLLAVEALLAGDVSAAALVLLAPALTSEPPPLVRAAARLPGTGLVGPAALRVALRGAAPFLRISGRHRTALTEATAAETGRSLRRPGTATAMWHLTRSWHPPAVAHRLGALELPVTVLVGADDRIVDPGQLAALVAPTGAGFRLLDGVGHAPQEQAPAVVVEAIAHALETCS